MSRVPRSTVGIIGVLLTALFLGGARAYAGQEGESAASPFQRLHTGDRIKIVTRDGGRLSGRISDLSKQSLTLVSDDGTTTIVPAARAGRIVAHDPAGNGATMGAGIGAAAGLAAGLAANAAFANEGGGSGGGALLLTGLGAAIGAGVGALADASRLQIVYDGMPGLSAGLMPEVTIGAAAGQLNAAGFSRLRTPVMVTGGWGIRHASGVAFEFQGHKSMGHTGGPGGPSGVQSGVDREWMATARMLYYFSNSRMQPYAGGGVTFFNSTVWGPQPTLSQFGPQPREDHGAAGVVAGGVRMVLTRRLTVRPEIAVHTNGRWTAVRAGAALGIHW
jgi:hypothetical protein